MVVSPMVWFGSEMLMVTSHEELLRSGQARHRVCPRTMLARRRFAAVTARSTVSPRS
ncbi:hypothetical protein JNW90_30515 [Micromonospora sp. STR1s_5]|nr:hypothetical protein [Micromonospora sp. STR1s_5]